ncbi:MAG TPA: hypothetical protein VF527_20130, partial [Pyrinomonadaceae bacterium]
MPHRISLCALLLASAVLVNGCAEADNANSANRNANSANTARANATPATTGATGGATSGAPAGATSNNTANSNTVTGNFNRRAERAMAKRSSNSAEDGIGDDSGEDYRYSSPRYEEYSGATKSPSVISPAPTPLSSVPFPGASAGSSTPAPRGDGVDGYLNSLPLGEVAFNTPEKTTLNQTFNLELKLGKSNLVGQLEELIEEEGKVESHPVKVGKVMEAQLAGAGFQIVPVTPAEQAVSESEPTEWEWQVKAKQEGTQLLHLTLNAVI